MRSRVTAKCWPTSSRVCSEPVLPRPKRIFMTFSSRGVSVARTSSVISRKLEKVTDSAGFKIDLSSIKSPRCESSSSPIGEEEDSHLGDFIEDRQVVSPAEAVINLNLKEQIGRASCR